MTEQRTPYTASEIDGILAATERIDRLRIPYLDIAQCALDLRRLSGGMHASANVVTAWLDTIGSEGKEGQ